MIKKVLSELLTVCMVFGLLAFCTTLKASAENTDVYQVNGKYTISNSKLVTKCRLETADRTLKKKTRTYKITSKTKFYYYTDDDVKKKVSKKKAIKHLKKKKGTIQFKEKKGKVTYILYFN